MELNNRDVPIPSDEIGSKVKSKDGDTVSKEANFEEAVVATGYGKFHYLLYLVIIPASWASGFDTSTTSMIIPSAECDLNLTLFQKGVLNAVVYAGMVSSALIWGFTADAFGRKPIVFYGYFLDGVLNLLSGLSQNFYILVVFKLVCGFIVSGPYASVMTYCAEFHCTKDRPKITMLVGFLITAGSIVGAALALLIIPLDWTFSYGSYEIHSWQIYLSICGLPILFGSSFLSLFPESPKFLMSQGRNEEALKVFQRIYSINTGEPRKAYPIKILKDELGDNLNLKRDQVPSKKNESLNESKGFIKCMREGVIQMKPLFLGSYSAKLLLVVTIQFCGMLSTNTIRLWQPQLFAILGQSGENDTEVGTFCDMIDQSIFSGKNDSANSISNNIPSNITCVRKTVNNSVYINTIIISASSLFFTFFAGVLVSVVNNKHLLLIFYFTAACAIVALNWSKNVILTLILISLFVGCLSATVNLVVSVVVNLFPTTMRTMAVSLTMMFGRIGSLIGNTLFPVLLLYGCNIALLALTILVTISFILTIFIPKPKESMK